MGTLEQASRKGAYVALKPIKVGARPVLDENGDPVLDVNGRPQMEPVIRQPGDLVPEAMEWKNASSYVDSGSLQYIPGEMYDMSARLEQAENAVAVYHGVIAGLQEQVEELQDEVADLRSNAHTHNKPKSSKSTKKGDSKNDKKEE